MGGVQELKEKVAQATRMLAREGIIAASGHVSARIPGTDRILIGPGYVTRDILTADDVITVDLNLGSGRDTVWTCDLTKEYVAINGDYRS